MTALQDNTTHSLVLFGNGGTPPLPLTETTEHRTWQAVMWRCHQAQVVSGANGRSDWRRHMTALVEVAGPLERRRVVVCLPPSRQLVYSCEALMRTQNGAQNISL